MPVLVVAMVATVDGRGHIAPVQSGVLTEDNADKLKGSVYKAQALKVACSVWART